MNITRIAILILADGNLLQSIRDNCEIPELNPGRMLGHGKQGEVYDLGDEVLKLQVAPDEESAKEKVSEIQRIQNLDSSVYPKISDAGVLCEVQNSGIGIKDGFSYFYVMEKLHETKGAEEISNIVKAKVHNKPIKNYIDSPYLDEALELYERLEESGSIHVDINPGNIMESSDGVLKLVDLDSVVVASNHKNWW